MRGPTRTGDPEGRRGHERVMRQHRTDVARADRPETKGRRRRHHRVSDVDPRRLSGQSNPFRGSFETRDQASGSPRQRRRQGESGARPKVSPSLGSGQERHPGVRPREDRRRGRRVAARRYPKTWARIGCSRSRFRGRRLPERRLRSVPAAATIAPATTRTAATRARRALPSPRSGRRREPERTRGVPARNGQPEHQHRQNAPPAREPSWNHVGRRRGHRNRVILPKNQGEASMLPTNPLAVKQLREQAPRHVPHLRNPCRRRYAEIPRGAPA